MTREEASQILKYNSNVIYQTINGETDPKEVEALDMAIKALEQEPCEMTAEEYRQRMIQAFHNADTDELIAICALPTEKEFKHLEWLLKNHYKKEPCSDAISRQVVKEQMIKYGFHAPDMTVTEFVEGLPPVNPQPNIGHWYRKHSWEIYFTCSECGTTNASGTKYNYCPSCGCRMVEPQESEE